MNSSAVRSSSRWACGPPAWARKDSRASVWCAPRCPNTRLAWRATGTAATGKNSARRPAGLFSTPEDFAVLCALMLNAGRWGDVQLLSPATVRMMTSNRLNDLPESARTGSSYSAVGPGLAAESPRDARQLERFAGPARLRPYRFGGQPGLDGPTHAGVLHPVHELSACPRPLAVGASLQCDSRGVHVSDLRKLRSQKVPTFRSLCNLPDRGRRQPPPGVAGVVPPAEALGEFCG